MADEWIVVPKWEEFQQYTERNPVWIKLYTTLGSDVAWDSLSLSARGLLTSLWVEYARSRCQIRVSDAQRRVVPRGDAKYFRATFKSLIDAGWVEISATQPRAYAHTRSREKRREEKEVRQTPKPAKSNGPVKNRIPCPVCGAPVEGALSLAEHAFRLHDGPYPEHWDDG